MQFTANGYCSPWALVNDCGLMRKKKIARYPTDVNKFFYWP